MKVESNAKLVTDNRVLGGICRKYGMKYYKYGAIYDRNGAPEVLEYKGMAYKLVIVYARNKSLQVHLFIAETGKLYEKYMQELGLEVNQGQEESKHIKSNIIHEDKYSKVYLKNDNQPMIYSNRIGGVIIPYDEDKNVYLVKREVKKKSVNGQQTQVYYELPSGYYGEDGRVDSHSILNNFLQLGYVIQGMECLGEMQPDREMLQSIVRVHRALVVSNRVVMTLELEKAGIVRVSKAEILGLIARNQIICGKTLASLMRYMLV